MKDPIVLEGIAYATVLAIVVVALFAGLDVLTMYPNRTDSLLRCALIRLAQIVPFAIFVFRYFIHSRRVAALGDPCKLRQEILLGAGLVQVVGVGTVLLVSVAGGAESNYFAGLIMVFVGISVMVPWKPRFTALQILVTLAVHVLITTATWWQSHRHLHFSALAWSNFVFVVGGAVVSIYGSKVFYEIRCEVRKRTRSEVSGQAPEGDSSHKPNFLLRWLSRVAASIATTLAMAYVQESWNQSGGATFIGEVELLRAYNRGSANEFLVLKNSCGGPIRIAGAQLVIRSKQVLDVSWTGGNEPAVDQGEEFLLYTQARGSTNYSLLHTNAVLAETTIEAFRLVGWRYVD